MGLVRLLFELVQLVWTREYQEVVGHPEVVHVGLVPPLHEVYLLLCVFLKYLLNLAPTFVFLLDFITFFLLFLTLVT